MRAGLIGFGELGSQIRGMLEERHRPISFVYFDDVALARGVPRAYPFEAFPDRKFRHLKFFVALGYKHLDKKAQIIRVLLDLGRHLPVLVHETSYINPHATLGPGTVVYPGCNVDRGVEVGTGVLLNNSVVVSHDSRVGDCAYLSPGVVLSGRVSIGPRSFLGSGCVVSNGVRIGAGSKVGIGTVVTADVPSDSSVIGNPMKRLRKALRLS